MLTAANDTLISPRPGRAAVWLLVGTVLAGVCAAGVYWFVLTDHNHNKLPPDEPPEKRPSTAAWFRDMTQSSGLDFTYHNGEEANQFTILESVGGGVALIDYDGDGLLDIFVTGGGSLDNKQIKGHPCKLYRNLGQWKFQEVTKDVGLDGVAWWYTHGAAVADYDCDGRPDLLVTGYGQLKLFRNEDGKRFVDVTDKVGLKDDSWSTSAGWADLDGDGYPDLYVCHYVDWSFANNPICPDDVPRVKRDVCPPQKFKPLVHAVFHNDKGKAFRNMATQQDFKAAGCGLGVVLADLNDDGRPDIYVGNDASNNFLFYNRGGKLDVKGTLEEKGFLAGVAVDDSGLFNGSMGVDVGDYEGSGKPALWVSNFQGELHALYAMRGPEYFDHRSRVAGIGAIGQHYVGFGTSFIDIDSDGWLDLVVINGHVLRAPSKGSTYKQKPVLLRNGEHEGRRFFRDVSQDGGPFFQSTLVGRGLAVGDLDNDGRPDLVVSQSNGPITLLRNEAVDAPRWVGIQLKGRDNRDIAGATVVVQNGERRLSRFTKGGGSYLSANDQRLLFGLGAAQGNSTVTVRWPWGETQTFTNLEPGAYWELSEGETTPRRITQ